MEIPDENPVPVYIKDLKFPVVVYKQVFKNKDGSAGVRYLVTNDKTMNGDRFKTLYKKRWSVEVYHESIKQNTSTGSSPAHTERTQSNHVFASIYAYTKLELAKLSHGYNHFAVKSQIYPASLKRAMELLSAFNLGDNGVLAQLELIRTYEKKERHGNIQISLNVYDSLFFKYVNIVYN
jgi:hypothetical protein